MAPLAFIDNAKVMPKGQITIPRDIREILGVNTGDRVSFIVENGNIRLVNSAEYAMAFFQQQMQGIAKSAGISSEDDVSKLVKDLR